MRHAVLALLATCPLWAQSFDPLATAFAQPRNAHVFAVADFDGDGDDDVVMQVGAAGVVRWELHRNDGEGVLVPEPIAVPLVGIAAFVIATGDFDGDGDLDVVAVNNTSISYTTGQILFNNGQGGFQSVTMPNALEFAAQILPIDVDGDSDLDLVFANANQHVVSPGPSQLLHDGSGNFTDVTATWMPNPAALRFSVAALDVQGDGLVDLVFDGWPLFVMLRQPAGGFVPSPGVFSTGMGRIRAVDADGDGDLDLVGLRSGLLVIQRNDGAGVFTTLNHPVPGIDALHAADIDGDGDHDFLTNSNASTDNRLWRTDPGLLLVEVTSSQLPPLVGPSAVGAFFDSDGDGDRDLWLPKIAPLLHNDGTGRFADLGTRPALTFGRAVAITDVDGDGHADIVGLDTMAGSGTTLALAWWQGDGTGQFERAAVLATVPVCDASKVVAFDMDGDGDDEIWSLQCGLDRVWRNDGGGALVEITATAFPLDTRTDVAVLVRDFDGDGDLDAFVPRDYLFDSLYLNQGNATFVDGGNTRLTDNELTLSAAALDYDGDGDVDLALANDPTTLRLFRNDGTGWFTDDSAGRLPTLSGTQDHVIAADIDADGDDDLLLTSSGWSTLLRNDGGIFTHVPAQLPGVTNGYWPEAVDFDLDGDLDLLHGRDWLVNDGTGTFSLSPVRTPMPAPSIARTHAFADLDSDGDPDVVHGSLVRNLHRQLENALPPRLGYHGEIRMHARPAQPGWPPLAVLYFSDTLATPVGLGPFGTLHLNAGALALLSSHVVPAQPGYAAARYLVPNQPGLLGVTIPLQALVVNGANQAHTTNAILIEIEQ